jgi:aspartyl-tRNA(Asn)/glutamyl-tRNA(Gln) amidotransferase subunit A
MNSPVYQNIRKLSEQIVSLEISPIELTQIFLERLEEYGPELNAVVTITKELALKQATKAEKEIKSRNYKGFLHGIPWGAKDLLATSGGIPTTWGSFPFKNQVFDYDSTVVTKLENAGAILVSKLAMIELAGGMGYRQPNASFTGPCSNPWDKNTWSGGSSSGSGSAVSAGLVPFAIGSETWGSILSPANNCGVAGLRPTYGRVSKYGAMALCWTLDKLGPLCLTADDCGIVLEAISGYDIKDRGTSKLEYRYEEFIPKDNFKIAVLKDATVETQEDVKNNFNDAMRELEKIADIEEIEFPNMPYEAITRTILNAEAAAAFDEFTEKGIARNLTAPEDRYGPYGRTIVLAKDYLKALRLREKMAKNADGFMKHYDAVIAPSRRTVAPPIDKEFRKVVPGTTRDIMGAVGNGAGLPSISVPSGFSKEGLPTGIQFMGRAYEENKIITIARRYQELTNWHTKHPKDFSPK